MSNERNKENLDESAKNALTGYLMVALGIICFVLALILITAIVRIIIGAGARVSV